MGNSKNLKKLEKLNSAWNDYSKYLFLLIFYFLFLMLHTFLMTLVYREQVKADLIIEMISSTFIVTGVLTALAMHISSNWDLDTKIAKNLNKKWKKIR